MTEPEIIDSPLSQTIHQDASYVEVQIYRLDRDKTWTLEIVADDGTSTVWDDQFKSDQDALDEALSSIEEDGIESFREDTAVSYLH